MSEYANLDLQYYKSNCEIQGFNKERFDKMLKRNRVYLLSVIMLIITGCFLTSLNRQYIKRQTDVQDIQETSMLLEPESVLDNLKKDSGYTDEEGNSGLSEKDNYLSHIEEIDDKVDEAREKLSVNTVNFNKSIADYELKLWDDELNKIYNLLKNKLDSESFEKLRSEEREWIVQRDEKAASDAKRYAGKSTESLKYTESLISSTKARTYDLIDIYFSE